MMIQKGFEAGAGRPRAGDSAHDAPRVSGSDSPALQNPSPKRGDRIQPLGWLGKQN